MSQTILLAEDESVVSNFVKVSLEREHFVVLLACNAEEALQVFRSQTIDLVLTDVNCGRMHGVELAERIMKDKPGTKVLVMSGFPEKELTATEKKLPVLRKPFTPAILIERVRDVLSSKSPPQDNNATSTIPSNASIETIENVRVEMEAAAKAYQAAKVEYNLLMAQSQDLGNTHSDGAAAFRQAIRLRTSAFCKYVDAVKKFNDVVIHNAPPPEKH